MYALPTTRPLLALLVAATTLTACGSGGGSTDGQDDTGRADVPRLVATTTILGDLVQNVVGACATVEVVIPPGADPHDFEASAQQAAELREADLVFAFGLGLEESLHDVLDAAAADGVTIVEVAPTVDPLPFAEAPGADEDDHADDDQHADEDQHGELDPHVWQDPVRMAEAVTGIGAAITTADLCDDGEIDRQRVAYAETLVSLAEEVDERYATIPDDRRVLVTNHDAFAYLADRFDLEILGTVIPSGSTLAEPSAAEMVALIEVIEREQVSAIFGETTDANSLIETLTAELGTPVDVVELYSDALGEPGSPADTYVGLVRTNASLISDALSGE